MKKVILPLAIVAGISLFYNTVQYSNNQDLLQVVSNKENEIIKEKEKSESLFNKVDIVSKENNELKKSLEAISTENKKNKSLVTRLQKEINELRKKLQSLQ